MQLQNKIKFSDSTTFNLVVEHFTIAPLFGDPRKIERHLPFPRLWYAFLFKAWIFFYKHKLLGSTYNIQYFQHPLPYASTGPDANRHFENCSYQ